MSKEDIREAESEEERGIIPREEPLEDESWRGTEVELMMGERGGCRRKAVGGVLKEVWMCQGKMAREAGFETGDRRIYPFF
jgi:hypothetical protein